MLVKMTKMRPQIGLDGIKIPLFKFFLLVTASCQSSLFFQDLCCRSVGSKEEKPIQFQELLLGDTSDL
jgi:hypothetical protein